MGPCDIRMNIKRFVGHCANPDVIGRHGNTIFLLFGARLTNWLCVSDLRSGVRFQEKQNMKHYTNIIKR